MKNGPALVIPGTIIASIILALLGWFIGGRMLLSTGAEVAYAAAPSHEPAATQEVQACQVSSNFPRKILRWCEIITREANLTELPADLIAAVMLQESGGDEEAYSHSGAVGLMQVMPRDGIAASFECLNGPCFASRPTIQELLEPGFNVEYGSHMLAGLVERLGSPREALKAYGPMDVDYRYADKVLAIYERYR